MKKNKLYALISIPAAVLIIIVAIVLLFGTSVFTTRCEKETPEEEKIGVEGKTGDDVKVVEKTGETSENEAASEGKEEAEEGKEEETTEGATVEEEEGETAEEETTEETKEAVAPTISLEIYSGPAFSPADSVCYYRVKATVTGTPLPEIDFSKDDSGGSWGSNICQVNLHDPAGTYFLTATATNSEGTATDSIEISWGCPEVSEEEEEEGVVFEGFEKGATLTVNSMVINPTDIGYIVRPNGINTSTMIIGDSISNEFEHGYFGWSNLSSLSGREIESVTLTLNTYKLWGNLTSDICDGVCIILSRDEVFPLDAGDWWLPFGETEKRFAITEEPLVWSGTSLKNAIKNKIDEGRRADFVIHCLGFNHTDWDNQIDGREYRKQDITLTVVFGD
jgi:hypothetical protein